MRCGFCAVKAFFARLEVNSCHVLYWKRADDVVKDLPQVHECLSYITCKAQVFYNNKI